MIRAMLIIGAGALVVGLTIYALLDAVRTPAREERTLPKWLWVLVTLLFPVVGPLMWLILGRPKAQPAAGTPRPGFGQRRSSPAPSVSSPDDDEEYLRWLKTKADRQRRSREKDAGTGPTDDGTGERSDGESDEPGGQDGSKN